MTYAYLDSSALVKLAVREGETADLEHAVLNREGLFTSVIAGVELTRALRRVRRNAGRLLDQADGVLGAMFLAELTPAIRDQAGRLEPAGLRSLDALHVATAVSLALPDMDFITYDDGQAAAAEAVGLRVVQPGRKRHVARRAR